MSISPVLTRLALQGVVGARVQGSKLISCSLAPTSLTIPAGITEIASYCFSGQDHLVQVYLVNDVVRVGQACFANCPKLRLIVCNKVLKPYEMELRSGNRAVVYFREG